MNCIHYDDLHIDEEWFNIGNEREGNSPRDIVFKFITYWIAFNAIFAKYQKEIYKDIEKNNKTKTENESEARQIIRLINDKYDECLKGIINFNDEQALNIFKEAPVFKSHIYPDDIDYLKGEINTFNYNQRHSIRIYRKFIGAKDPKKRLINLLLMIKQVRNNLFHGQKTYSPERNFDLVNSSQQILEIILQALIYSKRY